MCEEKIFYLHSILFYHFYQSMIFRFDLIGGCHHTRNGEMRLGTNFQNSAISFTPTHVYSLNSTFVRARVYVNKKYSRKRKKEKRLRFNFWENIGPRQHTLEPSKERMMSSLKAFLTSHCCLIRCLR